MRSSATINTSKDKPVSSQLKKQSKKNQRSLKEGAKVRLRQKQICQALLVKSYVAKVTKKVLDSLWGL